jgi:hypothetical protein
MASGHFPFVPTQMLGWLTLLGLLITPSSTAHAFSDPAYFGQATVAAGGGGRYFTGSPADGYTCKVCHEGGPETKLRIVGLPLAGYHTAERYEIVITWPNAAKKFALAMELTDEQGKPAGTVRLPPSDEITAEEFCEPASDMVSAAMISAASQERQVINLPDCGAKRLRLLWTAPTTDVGPVLLAGSAVTSDGEGDTHHDGVTDFGRVISSHAVASLTTANGSCAVRGPRVNGSGPSQWQLLAMSAGLWLGMLRLRRRGPH